MTYSDDRLNVPHGTSSREAHTPPNLPGAGGRGDRILNWIYRGLLYVALPAVLVFTTHSIVSASDDPGGDRTRLGCGPECLHAASKASCYACCRIVCAKGVPRIQCMKACDDRWGETQ